MFQMGRQIKVSKYTYKYMYSYIYYFYKGW